MSQAFSLFFTSQDRGNTAAEGRETTPGGNEEIRWEVVANTPGLTPAVIIGGRLEAEGIPVRTWQEGAGRAMGLTVGILGTAYVAVPEAYAALAHQILDEVDEPDSEESEAIVDDETVVDETVVDETVVDETVVDETVVDETVDDETLN